MLKKSSKIYTGLGDKGQTLVGGKTLPKNHPKLEALGALDELSSFLGLAASFARSQKLKKEIATLQEKIFEIGACLIDKKASFKKEEIKLLEEKIKEREKKLPALSGFILPGGTREACLFHVCRTIARRAERKLVSLSKRQKLNPNLLAYLNRLSPFLFVLARSANLKKGKKETFWP